MWDDFAEYISNYCNFIMNKKNKIGDINKIAINDNIKDFNSEFNIQSENFNVSNNKKNKCSCKIVEIGIGKFFGVSEYIIKKSDSNNINFFATDIHPANENILFDDIKNPNMDIYSDADLIYSIRPPQELQPYIGNIVDKIHANLIIKPLFNEDLNLGLNMKLVNYKKAAFYQNNVIKNI